MKTTTVPHFPSRPVYSDIYPLDEFYSARGEKLPIIAPIPEVPVEPYRSLLMHKADMTSTLEKFHGETLHIEPLERHVHENEYFREVVLVLDQSKKRVEFGAIKIVLNLFPAEAQQEILRERQPLGRILNQFKISFTSSPSAYLRVFSDKWIADALQVEMGTHLFGRRNSLLDAWDRPLAEIVEILPFP